MSCFKKSLMVPQVKMDAQISGGSCDPPSGGGDACGGHSITRETVPKKENDTKLDDFLLASVCCLSNRRRISKCEIPNCRNSALHLHRRASLVIFFSSMDSTTTEAPLAHTDFLRIVNTRPVRPDAAPSAPSPLSARLKMRHKLEAHG